MRGIQLRHCPKNPCNHFAAAFLECFPGDEWQRKDLGHLAGYRQAFKISRDSGTDLQSLGIRNGFGVRLLGGFDHTNRIGAGVRDSTGSETDHSCTQQLAWQIVILRQELLHIVAGYKPWVVSNKAAYKIQMRSHVVPSELQPEAALAGT